MANCHRAYDALPGKVLKGNCSPCAEKIMYLLWDPCLEEIISFYQSCVEYIRTPYKYTGFTIVELLGEFKVQPKSIGIFIYSEPDTCIATFPDLLIIDKTRIGMNRCPVEPVK